MVTAYLELTFELADYFDRQGFNDGEDCLVAVGRHWWDRALELFRERLNGTIWRVDKLILDGLHNPCMFSVRIGDREIRTARDGELVHLDGKIMRRDMAESWLAHYREVKEKFEAEVNEHYEDMRSNQS
jgi:hypothetical protein